MLQIVYSSPLPEGDFYITDVPFYSRIRPDKLDVFFAAAEPFNGALAELLLNNESTAIYHLAAGNIGYLGDNPFVKPILLGVNYHRGHSEGDYKIIVQNIPERKGPWVLFRPPNSQEITFYLQNMIFPRLIPPQFQEDVDGPLKILRRYLHRGDPMDIFSDFQRAGFTFSDKPMAEEYLEKVGYVGSRRL